MRLDCYEYIRLLERSNGAKMFSLLIILGSVILISRLLLTCITHISIQRWRMAWGVILFLLLFPCIMINKTTEEYALTLLSSENDSIAASACSYLSRHLSCTKLKQWLSNELLSANERYYLAVAVVLKGEVNVISILRAVTSFKEPYFFQHNGLNDIKGIQWPISGDKLYKELSIRIK
jgi:hypothetical protein